MLRLDKVRAERDGFALTADWQLPAPGRCAIIGPSGAGKSTLLDVLAGFAQSQTGRVTWHDRDISNATPADRPVAILFQDNNLFPHLSLFDNLMLALRPRGGRATEADRVRVRNGLARVGLDGLSDRKPGTLSGGQQSRAALARVLLQNKPILALDEPFAALGPALKADMLALVQEIASEINALVLLVTHDPDDAKSFAENTVLVTNGIAHAPRKTAELFDNPPDGLRDYLGT